MVVFLPIFIFQGHCETSLLYGKGAGERESQDTLKDRVGLAGSVEVEAG